MFLLVCYDISDERRLRQIAKIMQRFGDRVQKSVFECHLEPRQYTQMRHKVQAVMDASEDSVRVYPLCQKCCQARQAYGQGEVSDLPEVFII